MTRAQEKQLKEAMQQSVISVPTPSGPSSSSTDPSSSAAWFLPQNIKSATDARLQAGSGASALDFFSGTAGSETATSYEDALPQKGGLKDLGGMTSTDDDRMRAHELGLAPSPPGFFDSSQDVPTVLSRSMAAPSDPTPNRQQMTRLEVVVEKTRPSSTRSTGSATPARLLEASDSSANSVTPITKKKEGKGRRSSAALSEASTTIDVDDIGTPSSRPRRGVAGPKDYSIPWNVDGTEIKEPVKKGKSNSGKEPQKSSGKASSTSRKGSQAEEPIEIDDEEEEEAVMTASAKRAADVARKAVRSLPAQREDTVDSEQGESVTVLDVESGEEEEVVSGRKRGPKEKAKKRTSTVIDEDVEMASDTETLEKAQAKGKSKTKAVKGRKSRLRDSDDEDEVSSKKAPDRRVDQATAESEADKEAMVAVEIPITKGRWAKKAAANNTKGKSRQSEAAEKEATDDDKEASPEDREQEEEELQPNKGSKGKATVLADASSAVNAGRKGSKAVEIKTLLNSSSSTPQKSTILDAAKRFWGKPLSSLLGPKSHRSPGLAKRKIAPLLTVRNEPPPKRAAIPIPKSRQKNKDEDLDSDEEAARANETPEERMARYIQEQDEGD